MSPTVTAAEIARLAGVGRAAVSNWRKRHADFPAQVGGTATSPRFDLVEVEEWLRRQGRLDARSAEDRLWWSLAAAGENPVMVLATVGETLLREHGGVFGEESADRTVSGRMADLLRDVCAMAADLGAARTFEMLRQRLTADPSGRGRDFPDDLADLMAGLAGVRHGTVLDPSCGLGALLRGAVRAGCVEAYGQDLDPDGARLTRVWLGLHDVAGDVAAGDSLRADAYAEALVDAVVCAPPIGQSAWGQEELAYDPRWVFGVPPRTEPELAWVQHAIAHLRPGGRAVVLMPPAAAGRRAGRRIRAELLRRGALRAVIALPARAAAAHGVPLHLWVLRRPVPGESPLTHLLLVDVTDAGRHTVLADFPAETVSAWVATPDSPVDGVGRQVAIVDLLDDQVDVTPARRVALGNTEGPSGRLPAAQHELRALVAELPGLLPELAAGEDPTDDRPVATVAELARAGALQILGPTRHGSGDPPARPVLTVKDVLHAAHPTGAPGQAVTPEIDLFEGDVVIPVTARRLVARVVGPDEAAMLGPNLVALRPTASVLDPWFLAGQLSTSANNHRQSGSLAGVVRFDARRAQVVRLPYDRQRPYGDAFRKLAALDAALRRLTTLGEEVTRLGVDGLAGGALRPDATPTEPPARMRPSRRRRP